MLEGLEKYYKNYIQENNLAQFKIARVTQEHRERYVVVQSNFELEAEITGNLRFSAESRSDFPAVGDYVLIDIYDENTALIHHILPRKTVLERQAVGKIGEKQIIASNIDEALIVQSVDNNFNLNRLERYITICNSGSIKPLLILSKIDLISSEQLDTIRLSIKKRAKNIEIYPISNLTREGFDKLNQLFTAGKSYCILGSSGVGKSTLINTMLNQELLKTSEISESVNKGRHTTTHRELVVLPNGSIIIDTPGMRELGITENQEGLYSSYENIVKLSQECRFNDCTHENEAGCAVLEAIESGKIEEASYHNFKKMEREQRRFSATTAELRKKSKAQGKLYKSIIQSKKKRKFGED